MLFKSDFVDDEFSSIASRFNNKQKLLLAYRLAKYAQQNKYGVDVSCLNRPLYAVKNLMRLSRSFSEDDILLMLLDYIFLNSCLLVKEDILSMFGNDVATAIEQLQQFNTVVSSRAKITSAKQSRYRCFLSKRVCLIKAAVVIAELKSLTLLKAKSFPVKVHERYIPMFDVYPEIGDDVIRELRFWLLQKVRVAQSSKDYNLTVGDLFRYFSIIQDKRLGKIKFPSIAVV
jgi:hypothetical protein